jgi:hypothetical protein
LNFRFVQYGGNAYPDGIVPELVEVAGHLDKDRIEDLPNYSLHTEYSYGKRKLSSDFIKQFPVLCDANKEGVPQLWKNTEWAAQFAEFVISLTKDHAAPKVVEIHPPFNDYCDIDQFIERYSVFEKRIHSVYQDAEIVVENRAGTVYHGGRFIVGKAKEIAELCTKIRETEIKLGVVLDFPQLLTAEYIKPEAFRQDKYSAAIETIFPYQREIKGIHIWGKKKSASGSWVAHNGTLETYIENPGDRAAFISGIKKICSDGQSRFFVPEVNSGENDLKAVVRDVLN